jgi:4-amino-4-deoxy-L-arabinose transferase-like glycosyltransferase
MSKKLLTIFTIISFLLFAFVLIKDINDRPVERWDEQTNIDVVRQSITDNEFYLSYNKQPFFEKPPLWYYMTAIPVLYAGDNMASFRIVSVISSLLIVLLTYLLVSRRSGPFMGMLSILVYLLIPQLYSVNPAGYFASHTFNSADLDVLQIFFIIFSIFALFYEKKPSPSQIFLSYFSLALGYLTKGPFVLIPLLLNSIYLKRTGLKWKGLLSYLGVFLIPVLSWHLYMQFTFGNDFTLAYIDYHILQRSITALEGHTEPIWFYIQLLFDPRLNLLALPVLISVTSFLRSGSKDHLKAFLLIFMVLVLILFTLTATKLAWYILPLYPLGIIFLFI